MVQQSTEKYIKSVLVHLQISFPAVHDLGILVALLPDDKIPPEGFGLTELNPFATVRRYEEGHLPLSESEIEISISTAKQVAIWSMNILSKE